VLAENFHVLVPDLPGHGRSGRAWVSLADTVQAAAELVRSRTAAGRAHVVGLSLGGYVAALLAANEPAVVHSVVVSGVNVLPFPHPTMMRLLGRIIGPFATACQRQSLPATYRDESFAARFGCHRGCGDHTVERWAGVLGRLVRRTTLRPWSWALKLRVGWRRSPRWRVEMLTSTRVPVPGSTPETVLWVRSTGRTRPSPLRPFGSRRRHFGMPYRPCLGH